MSSFRVLENGAVQTVCPDCQRPASFHFRDTLEPREFGFVEVRGTHVFGGRGYQRILYYLYACVVCRRAGVLKTHADNSFLEGQHEWFWPAGIVAAQLPADAPREIVAEYREAERCATTDSWRAAAAMLRSALEKTLKLNGYSKGNLYDKIEEAAKDGTITASRKQSAHDVVRTLGNDVLHDEWRVVTPEEVEPSFLFVQRVIEDFYFNRSSVVQVLTACGRQVSA